MQVSGIGFQSTGMCSLKVNNQRQNNSQPAFGAVTEGMGKKIIELLPEISEAGRENGSKIRENIAKIGQHSLFVDFNNQFRILKDGLAKGGRFHAIKEGETLEDTFEHIASDLNRYDRLSWNAGDSVAEIIAGEKLEYLTKKEAFETNAIMKLQNGELETQSDIDLAAEKLYNLECDECDIENTEEIHNRAKEALDNFFESVIEE